MEGFRGRARAMGVADGVDAVGRFGHGQVSFPVRRFYAFAVRAWSQHTASHELAGTRPTAARRRGGGMSRQRDVSSARDEVRQLVPKLIERTETVLVPDICQRSGLSKRARTLITVATLVATYRPEP